MYLRIRSYKSKGSQPKEYNIKALLRNNLLFLFIRLVSQMELFYFYQSEADIKCAFAFRGA
jgi:hypothetical protein